MSGCLKIQLNSPNNIYQPAELVTGDWEVYYSEFLLKIWFHLFKVAFSFKFKMLLWSQVRVFYRNFWTTKHEIFRKVWRLKLKGKRSVTGRQAQKAKSNTRAFRTTSSTAQISSNWMVPRLWKFNPDVTCSILKCFFRMRFLIVLKASTVTSDIKLTLILQRHSRIICMLKNHSPL